MHTGFRRLHDHHDPLGARHGIHRAAEPWERRGVRHVTCTRENPASRSCLLLRFRISRCTPSLRTSPRWWPGLAALLHEVTTHAAIGHGQIVLGKDGEQLVSREPL